MDKKYLFFILITCILTACHRDFEEQKDPIIGNWKLTRIEVFYNQQGLESEYQSAIFPLDSNHIRFEKGGFYEALLNPSFDYLYFTRLGTSFRNEPRVLRGVWEYYASAGKPDAYTSGELTFDRGDGFFNSQPEFFLDYQFQKDSLVLSSSSRNYIRGILLRLLAQSEVERTPENTYEYGFALGQKIGFANGAVAASDSLEDISSSADDHFENIKLYWENLERFGRFTDYEEEYPTATEFLRGYQEGQLGQYSIGYNFVLGLDPTLESQEKVYYYFLPITD